MKLVEIEVPQSIGVLNKIMRQLEDYHAVRAVDPRAAYDGVAMARAIWAEEDAEKATEEAEPSEGAPDKTGNEADDLKLKE